MNILVTGGCGYIGSVVVEMLLDRGHKVSILDIKSEPHPAGVLLYQEDIENYESRTFQDAFVGKDAVIHLAAVADVEAKAEDCWGTNVIGSVEVMIMAIKKGIKKFVFASSAAVYGEPGRIPIKEGDTKKPINVYGVSKLEAEERLNKTSYSGYNNMNFIAFRFFNVAGATEWNGDHSGKHIIPNILRAYIEKKPFVINGNRYNTIDGTGVRDYIHVADVSEAMIMAVEGNYHSGFYNLGSGIGYSVNELVNLAQEVVKDTIETEITIPRKGDPAKLITAPIKWQVEARYEIQRTLYDMIRSQWEWMKKEKNARV